MPPASTALLTGTVVAAAAAISMFMLRYKWREMESKLRELQASLAASLEKCVAERQGRTRAQQALRKALLQPKSDNLGRATSYPMTPIGIIQSCFSTRNGTPRQPLLVPLARACLVFDPTRVPLGSLEGLEQYSHCWIIFIFHLNTDLDKLWKDPSKSKLKAKVRVPRLEGERMGVFATRSPHRPLPIGLTAAKVEAVQGHMVLLSGVDLVDGTPVLDIKPYLPYCDSIQEAVVPDWILADSLLAVSSVSFSECFCSALACCWEALETYTLYESLDEIESLIRQVLSWDIRSASQRTQPRNSPVALENNEELNNRVYVLEKQQQGCGQLLDEASVHAETSDTEVVVYHLAVEGLDISYRIDSDRNVVVEGVTLNPVVLKGNKRQHNYTMWKDKQVTKAGT